MEKHELTNKNMKKGSLLLIVIIAVAAILAVAGFFYVSKNGVKNPFAKANPCEKISSDNTAIITISSRGITPSTVMICPGQEVKWVNNDSASHKFTVTSKGEDSARLKDTDPIAPGETVSMSFTKPETVKYSLSNDIQGEIIVGKTEESLY